MSFRQQRIRDPLYGLIEFHAEEFENALWTALQTRPFQRLRRIKQLGFSDLVYPGAAHSRFAHSVGAFHTARRLMKVIKGHLGERDFKPRSADTALAAALVHDLGHGPFSHAFENAGHRLGLKMTSHELVGDNLIRDGEIQKALSALGSGFPNDVANVIKNDGPNSIYDAVVSSQFDADRLDYMQRDRLMTGTRHGAIDSDWLIANLEVGSVTSGVDTSLVRELETFVLGPKALHAAETYVLGLFQLYPTVYFHKATRGAEKLFGELLYQVIKLAKTGDSAKTGLPRNHPIIRFANQPDDIENFLNLDDTVVWGALSLMVDSQDQTIAQFAKRLRDRQLFKCIDVRELVKSKLRPASSQEINRICLTISKRIKELSNRSESCPRILMDETTRKPYNVFQESKGPLNQIRIRVDGELVDLGERSPVVKAIEPFQLFRLYLADDDQKTRQSIETVIEEEVKRGASTSS